MKGGLQGTKIGHRWDISHVDEQGWWFILSCTDGNTKILLTKCIFIYTLIFTGLCIPSICLWVSSNFVVRFSQWTKI